MDSKIYEKVHCIEGLPFPSDVHHSGPIFMEISTIIKWITTNVKFIFEDRKPLNNELWTILKVFALSFLLAIALKTVGPRFPLPQTNVMALTLVLLPPILMGLVLIGQGYTHRRKAVKSEISTTAERS